MNPPGDNFGLGREESFSIPAGDGKIIYGLMNKSGPRTADRLIVIAHGLTGHVCEYQHQAARQYFNDRGYDVVRISFYGSGTDARKLHECTLKIHADDLNLVTDHFSGGYKKTFVIGHSYGGLTILFANPKAQAVSFWDSSFVPSFWKTQSKYIPQLDCYSIGWGAENLVGKAMVEEAANLKEEEAVRMAHALSCPGQVILAGDNDENENRTLLFESLKTTKEIHDIPGADHCFWRGNIIDDVLSRTYAWFERF